MAVNLLERFAPLKSRCVRYTPKYWFNDEIKQAIDHREVVYDNCKVSNSRNAATHERHLINYEKNPIELNP